MKGTRESHAAAIDRIARDDQSRRELLWLRAKEKGDELDARRLLERDPTIPYRLRFFHEIDLAAVDGFGAWRRTEAYAALYDAHLDWLLGYDGSEHERLERRRSVRVRIARRL